MSDADLQVLDAKIVALTANVQSLQQSCRHMEAGRTGQPPRRCPWHQGQPSGQELLSEWFVDCSVTLLQYRSLCGAAIGFTLEEMCDGF